jgi:hypothetical protein
MWLIREGTVELTANGTSYRLGPASVGFVHSNDERRRRRTSLWLWTQVRILTGRRIFARRSSDGRETA